MSEKHTPVKNRFTHDADGHPYSFSLDRHGALQVNGLGAETWLCMALTAAECLELGDDRNGALSLRGIAREIRAALAAIANAPDTGSHP